MRFNKKYDAGHWNDLGAFYAVNNVISRMQQVFPTLKQNSMEDFDVQKELMTSLPVSEFPIEEEVPLFILKAEIEDITDQYVEEINLHPNFQGYGYYKNKNNIDNKKPRVLVFQGSYMNGKGKKFAQNAFGEYIHIHDYQNIINMDYYINIFKPDYIIFEVAEYTIINQYFDEMNMKNKEYNPNINTLSDKKTIISNLESLKILKGDSLSVVKLDMVPLDAKYVYFKTDKYTYDASKTENSYCITVPNDDLKGIENIEIIYAM